jgi:L-rhamnose mutarotase
MQLWLISCQDSKEPEIFKRYCKAVDLVADTNLIEEFKQLLNDDLWRAIVENWKEFGVTDVQIFQFETHLLMIIDTKLDFDLQEMESKLADLPELKIWIELSKKYLKPLPQAVPGYLWVLIDRVYKLDQENEYQTSKGYVETRLKEQTKRLCEIRELVDDAKQLEEYKYHHALGRAWPEITQGLKNAGIKNMEIYMVGNQTFKIYDVEINFDIKTSFRKTRNSKSEEWGALVGKSDRPILDKDGKRMIQFMERIF